MCFERAATVGGFRSVPIRQGRPIALSPPCFLGAASPVLTQVVLVLCALSGAPCRTYVEFIELPLGPSACEQAIDTLARRHAAPGFWVVRKRSGCELFPTNSLGRGRS